MVGETEGGHARLGSCPGQIGGLRQTLLQGVGRVGGEMEVHCPYSTAFGGSQGFPLLYNSKDYSLCW